MFLAVWAEIDCEVAKVVIEVFFKAFNEENTYVSCISFVSENIRASNDRESIDEIFLV